MRWLSILKPRDESIQGLSALSCAAILILQPVRPLSFAKFPALFKHVRWFTLANTLQAPYFQRFGTNRFSWHAGC